MFTLHSIFKSCTSKSSCLLNNFNSFNFNRFAKTLTPITPIVLTSLRDNKGARKPRTRLGRGEGSGHGGFCGRGHSGQNKRSGNKSPYAGFEGGQTPLWKRLPKIKGNVIRRQKFSIVTLERLQRWIDVGRVRADIPITMKEMRDSGLVGRVKDGIIIDDKGAPYFTTPVHIEATKFTKGAIETIEKVGGKAIAVYFSKIPLRALLKPDKFRIFPRRAEPVDTRDIDYYCDYENRGYIAMRVLPTYPAPTSTFYGGRTTPIQFTEPPLAPLKPTLKLLALREKWEEEDRLKNEALSKVNDLEVVVGSVNSLDPTSETVGVDDDIGKKETVVASEGSV